MSKRCFVVLKKKGTNSYKVASFGENYIENLVVNRDSVEFKRHGKVTLPVYNINEEYDLDTLILLELNGTEERSYIFKPESDAIIHIKKTVGRELVIDFEKVGKGNKITTSLGNNYDVSIKE